MAKQKILFDAGPMLDNRKTGVGFYVDHLVTSLQTYYTNELELTGYYFNFFNRRPNKVPPDSLLRFRKIWLLPGKIISISRRLGFQPWLELFVRQTADAIIFTNYVALPQLSRRKTALVIYDLSYLDVPQFTQELNLKFLKSFCSPSIRSADSIITISEFTRHRLKHHFPNLRANIVVTPIPPISLSTEKLPLSNNLLAMGIKPKSYILYVGTIEPRKNLEALLAAFALLDSELLQNYSLVLAGGKGWKDENILNTVANLQAKGLNVKLTGYVSENEKNALYSNTACFVLPSHYEGFGMPILEAMQCGVACAISDIEIFHEVAGEAAIYFDKDDPADMAEKISSLLNSDVLRKKLIQKGERQLKKFSWEENAGKVYQALK